VKRRFQQLGILMLLATCTAGAPASAQVPATTPCTTTEPAAAPGASLAALVTRNARPTECGTSAPKLAVPGRMTSDEAAMVILAMALKQATSQLYEDSRVDEQQGSTSNTSGSTSAVSSAAVPALLSVALENGAITSSRSGNTMTFRGNVAGIFRAIDKHGLLAAAAGRRDKWFESLSNLTLSASVDTSRGVPEGQDPRVTGDVQQLSAWSARGEFVNNHAKHLQQFWINVSTQTSLSGMDHPEALLAELDETFGGELANWVTHTNTKLSQAFEQMKATHADTRDCARNPLCDVLNDRLRDIPLPNGTRETGAGQESLPAAVQRVAARLTAWMAAHPGELASAVSGVILAGELTSDQGVTGSVLSTGRLIFAVNTPKATITANAGLTYPRTGFSDLTPLRPQSVEVAGQIDVPFGTATGIGRFVFSASVKVIHMYRDPLNLTTGLEDPLLRGDTKLGQFKLTIPTNGAGIKIPISLTVANRSDLIKEKVVRANVGVSYDLDSLLSRFR